MMNREHLTDLGKILLEVRIKLGLSQRKFAKLLELPIACYSNYERGRSGMTAERALYIKNMLEKQNMYDEAEEFYETYVNYRV